MSTVRSSALAVVLFVATAAPAAMAQPTGHDHHPSAPAKADAPTPDQPKSDAPAVASSRRIGDPYPLATCPISGAELGSMGKPVVKLYDGREVRFCCKACPPKFEKNLAESFAKLDKAIIKDQAPLYPLKTSVVTGKDLPAKPFEFVYGNRLIRVGDESEKASFMKDPAKHLAELDKAVIAAQGKEYPLKTCPVSHEALDDMGGPVDVVVAGRLIRLCCDGCKKDLMSNPARFVAIVDAARKDNAPAHGKDHPGDKHEPRK